MQVELTEDKKYRTTDGIEFLDREIAQNHQSELNKHLKLCPTCYGRKLNESGNPCGKCRGRGFQQILFS